MLKGILEERRAAFARLSDGGALMETFVLRNATEMRGDALPGDVRRGKPKECFANAANLAIAGEGDYFEGYAITGRLPIPIHHAWVVRRGLIIDNTWAAPERAHYMGVHFTRDVLRRELLKNKVYGLLDHGVGLNVALMVERDPGLADAVPSLKDYLNRTTKKG